MRDLVTRRPPEHVVARWRRWGHWTDESLGMIHWRAAAQWPDQVAVVSAEGQLTYAQLTSRAETVATALLEAGVGPGDVVSWTMPNHLDAVAVAIAIWRIGAVSNPIVHIYREHEQAYILDHMKPAAVVATTEYRGRRFADELDGVLATIGHTPRLRLAIGPAIDGWTSIDDLPARSLTEDVAPVPPDAAAIVLFTSGTTSNPKGVVHTSQSFLHEIRSVQREWAVSRRDVIFMASPLTHVTGLEQAVGLAGYTGATAVLMSKWDAAEAVRLIEDNGATLTVGATPFLNEMLQEYEQRGMTESSLRLFICGGASIPPSLIERAEQVGITACRVYGSTEYPTPTLASELDSLEKRSTTDGRVAEGAELQIVDTQGTPVPVGQEGEVCVRGPECMVGYTDPERNDECFDQAGWFYTGDLGVLDGDGYLTITGRIKDIINRGGEKFSARDIEDVLMRHPAVAEAAVFGVPGGRLGEWVAAAVVPRREADIDAAELKTFLEEERVARQKIPEEIRVVAQLPRTASGKIQKFVLVSDWTTSGVS